MAGPAIISMQESISKPATFSYDGAGRAIFTFERLELITSMEPLVRLATVKNMSC